MKVLIVVDMQNDFINGALGTAEAQAIVPAVKEKIDLYRHNGDTVIFTRDTHGENYLQTQEGQNLPVEHCIKGTHGWEISADLDVSDSLIIEKPSFGSVELCQAVKNLDEVTEIELVGLCTDICVISNAIMLKAFLPETKIIVDSACCAGVTPESHSRALKSMASCQISIS